MKILIVNFSDLQGGAARAASRLHISLLNENIDSKMFVSLKNGDNFKVLTQQSNSQKLLVKFKAIFNTFPLKRYKKPALFSPSFTPSLGVVKAINKLNPDIVHLHWVNAGMLRIEDLNKIKAPIVWSLHDMWAFTGGCHYSGDCSGYMKNCGKCPVLNSSAENDISRKIFKRKEKTFSKLSDITIVGLSKWLEESAKLSSLLKDKNIINLPNPIDIHIFKPFDKACARELWKLPKDKKLVLFGSMSATSDVRKGFIELSNALKELDNDNVELLIFGSSKPKNPYQFGFKTHYLGQLNDDISLVTLYNVADVMVVPSLQENLSNVIMESLACGTPVVAFNIGGNSDMIDHQKNGYLAKPYLATDLANGINWVINNNTANEVSQKAREKVIENFSNAVVAKKYIQLYTEILKK